MRPTLTAVLWVRRHGAQTMADGIRQIPVILGHEGPNAHHNPLVDDPQMIHAFRAIHGQCTSGIRLFLRPQNRCSQWPACLQVIPDEPDTPYHSPHPFLPFSSVSLCRPPLHRRGHLTLQTHHFQLVQLLLRRDVFYIIIDKLRPHPALRQGQHFHFIRNRAPGGPTLDLRT